MKYTEKSGERIVYSGDCRSFLFRTSRTFVIIPLWQPAGQKADKKADKFFAGEVLPGFTIEKATCDMSGVPFFDATYTYDGSEKRLAVAVRSFRSVTARSFETDKQRHVRCFFKKKPSTVKCVLRNNLKRFGCINPRKFAASTRRVPEIVHDRWYNEVESYGGCNRQRS